jgi:hypothetical protein
MTLNSSFLALFIRFSIATIVTMIFLFLIKKNSLHWGSQADSRRLGGS